MNIQNGKIWFALYVKSRAEKKVESILMDRGIEAYVPLITSVRQWSDRKKKVSMPLLSGYVFVKISLAEKESVLQTNGVVSFVKYCGKEAVVREDEILRLKQLAELGFIVGATSITKTYNKGDRVKINYGPLKNIEGYVLEESSDKQVEIVLESIGQVLKVKLPPQLITETTH